MNSNERNELINSLIDFVLHGDIHEAGWNNLPDQRYVQNYEEGDIEAHTRLSIAASLEEFVADAERSEIGRYISEDMA